MVLKFGFSNFNVLLCRYAWDIPAALDKLVAGYEAFQAAIRVTTVAEAADAYLQVYAGCLGL